jgi:hypothetical protein
MRGNWDASLPGRAPSKCTDPPANTTPPGCTPLSPHPSSYQCKVIGCNAPVVVGYGSDSVAAVGTKVQGHLGGGISGPDTWTTAGLDEAVAGVPDTYTASSQGLLADYVP